MTIDDRNFLQQVGFRIRERRTELNFTQAELAERCGLHRTFIGSVERGERNVAILNLRLIAHVLRVPLAALFQDAQPAPDAGSSDAEAPGSSGRRGRR